jgi:hypothetical protein
MNNLVKIRELEFSGEGLVPYIGIFTGASIFFLFKRQIMSLFHRVVRVFYRPPDKIIKDRENLDQIYLRRWHVIPKNPFFNIYLHNFRMGDH